jgi:integrase
LVGKRFLVNQGHSEEIAERMMAPQCDSTLNMYDKKWNQFYDYAEEHGFDPFDPSIPQIASFLQKKFSEGQGHRSVEGYKAALSATLKHHTKLRLESNVQLSEQIKGYKIERPRNKKSEPEWDISFLLWSLAHEPFEPIEDPKKVSMKLLTWKTVFLLLLASGARRGELHAVREETVKIAENERYAVLSPSSTFIAKNEVARGKPLDPFVIHSLKHLSGDDKALCPVRCLQVYRKRSRKIRNNKKLLFVTLNKSKKEIHKNTISSWIKQLLLFCYENPGNQAVQLSGTGCHEIRRVASTLVFRGTQSIEDLLKVGSWKNHSTFTDYYMKDLSLIDGRNLRRIGPISVGQKVLLNTKIL